MNWQALLGKFSQEKNVITFHGESVTLRDSVGPAIGNYISDRRLSSGTVSARIKFETISEYSSCAILLFYQPSGPAFLTSGIGGGFLFSIRSYVGSWNYLGTAGDRSNLKAGHDYHISTTVIGSRINLSVDGVEVIRTMLPIVPPQGQVGIWCSDVNPIRISNYTVSAQQPRAFVVMQFTKPYNELYSEVIKPVCDDEGVLAERADETFGPGIIVADIARQIAEAHIVVAEISPANQNVYYEVGYAHALNKPTILIAEQNTKLPFDVSPFRILFYENSIEGKRKIEEGFRKHLRAILSLSIV